MRHAQSEKPDLVLLPEMPFARWFGVTPTYDAAVWSNAVATHERWLERLPELVPAAVLASRPVTRGGERLNEAFVWSSAGGIHPAHLKRYLPDEEGFWEARWYHPGDGAFEPVQVGPARVGVLICTEMWSMGDAQRYGKAGVHLIATPRATGRPTVEKWVTGGRVAAVVSGAYSISSNRSAGDGDGDFGGGGWIIDPDGKVLALTSAGEPFRTVDVDLAAADAAKSTYPRYALD